MIGVSITLTLKGPEEEDRFLKIFTSALPFIAHIPGLLEFQASKVIGKEHAYHVFSRWESEQAVEAWLANPMYKEKIRAGGEGLLDAFISYRWQAVRPSLQWP